MLSRLGGTSWAIGKTYKSTHKASRKPRPCIRPIIIRLSENFKSFQIYRAHIEDKIYITHFVHDVKWVM